MANIYNFLKNVFQDLKKENNENRTFIPLILLLISIPLGYALNNIALGIFIFSALITFKRNNFTFQKKLFLPIALYVLMAISFIWTIDQKRTLSALPKELPLLLIPLAFLIIKKYTQEQKQKILKYYSFGMVAFAIFYLLKAAVRFAITQNLDVFFYHQLVTEDLNAIHVSVYFSVAFFYFFTKIKRNYLDIISVSLLLLTIILLSSKNIIIAFVFLIFIHYLFFSKISKKAIVRSLAFFTVLIIALGSIGKIRDRFLLEYKTNLANSTINEKISVGDNKVYNISVSQAWNQPSFQPTDFFPGTAFRVYQIRVFKELLEENNIFFTGFGLNASYEKINEKAIELNVYRGDASNNFKGYHSKNFHNQYIQNFAELGFFGFLILVIILSINIGKAFKTKDFVHFTFAFLMISLFLTESFLWRQRGVMYFSILYCLFNSTDLIKARKNL